MTDVFRLVYCSRRTPYPAEGDPAAELNLILRSSRANNGRDGVTGALLCNESCFAQVLEGDLDDVQRTFERIQCDPRHADVIVLDAGRCSERLFGRWDMAHLEPADPAAARAVLLRALAEGSGDPGRDVVGLMTGLLGRERDWNLASPVPGAPESVAGAVAG